MKKSSKIIAVLLSLCLVTGLGFGLTPLVGTASEEAPAVEEQTPESAAEPEDSSDSTAEDIQSTQTEEAAESEDLQKTESVPETAEEPEAAAEPEEQAPAEDGKGVSKTAQAEVEPIAVENGDYYVVWDRDNSKLTFQTTRPEGGTYNSDWWGYASNANFTGPESSKEWHASEIKNNITTVEFANDITLDGGHMFEGFTALESVTGTGNVTLQGRSSGNHMFVDCSRLVTVDFNLNGSSDASLNDMFLRCSSLKSLDLSKWNVSEVTAMSQVFYGCSSLESVNLEGWDTSNATDMGSMFQDCSSLKTLTGLSNWNTENVTAMSAIFSGCSSLTELNLGNWNTEKVNNERSYFSGCTSLRKLTVGAKFHMEGDDTNADNIHDAQNSGIWVSETDKGGPQYSDADFIKMFENGNAAGTYIWVHTLTYNANGHDGTVPEDSELYGYGENATLKDQGGIQPHDQEVFIGWSEDVKDTAKTEEDATGVLEAGGTLSFENANKTLYAVFAEDKNRNGTPDYDDTNITVTFDINGGDGSKEEPPHNDTYKVSERVDGTPLIEGTPLTMSIYATLKWEKTWTKDGSPATHPAILEGWSTEKIGDIILEGDRDSGGAGLSKKLINRSQAEVPGQNTTYYAVYAADENGDHIADYRENSVQVEYYANGGTRKDGRWVDKNKGIFYRCSHHHVHNEDGVVLMDLDQGKAYVERDGAVLIGWSEKAIDYLVASNSQEASANIITTVKMPADGNKQVYAVWAEDVNNNGRADYKESKVTLTFDINQGDGSGDTQHKTTYTVELLPGTEYDLPNYSDLHWAKEWEKDGQSADYPAVLAGWTEKHPVDGIILEDDVNDQAETHAHLSDQMIREPHITVPTVNTTYYAIYAADENNDDEPDYLEYAEQVEYYANGGTMINGAWLDGIDGLFYRCGHHHVAGETVTLIRTERGNELIERDGAVLIGWSEKQVQDPVATENDKAAAGIITELTMPDVKGNAKVYAVWAADSNNDLVPDYNEENNGAGTVKPPSSEDEPDNYDEADASGIPQTGDESHPVMWLILAVLALAGIAAICVTTRRKEHQR